MTEAGLFLAAFLAATLLPFSSEVALVAAITTGMPVVTAVVLCSLGNCLACLVNYKLGDILREKMPHRLRCSRGGRVSIRWMERYGKASLFASWLPLVGDPLTVAAGMARVGMLWFVTVVCTLRIVRYIVIAEAVS